MIKPTFFQMFVPGDSNANPHVFFPLFYKVVRINLLGGNQPHSIFYDFFTNQELIQFLIVGIS